MNHDAMITQAQEQLKRESKEAVARILTFIRKHTISSVYESANMTEIEGRISRETKIEIDLHHAEQKVFFKVNGEEFLRADLDLSDLKEIQAAAKAKRGGKDEQTD